MAKAINGVTFVAMYSKRTLAFKYLHYLLSASNGKGHGVHSPFVFNFITKVLNDKGKYSSYQPIENARKALLQNRSVIQVEDYGAGSAIIHTKERKISSIAATSLKPKKFSQLLYRMVAHYQPVNIVEIGTSLGITTSYLALANASSKVFTFEGSHAVAQIANNHFGRLGLSNIELIEGNFEDILSPSLQKINTVDFAFIDGNHRYHPTIQYFQQILKQSNNNTIFVLDDIYWSEEMEQAWNWIKQHERVTLSIDLFFIGIIFIRKEILQKQHFSIRF